ncbi:hypothetical protein [Xanthomonas axonopodis]
MLYHWLITHDHIDTGSCGTKGPRGNTRSAQEIRQDPKGVEFKLRDDDGNLSYQGIYVGPDDETLFAPLDDFGMPNAGCTEIAYKNALGNWEWI